MNYLGALPVASYNVLRLPNHNAQVGITYLGFYNPRTPKTLLCEPYTRCRRTFTPRPAAFLQQLGGNGPGYLIGTHRLVANHHQRCIPAT